MLRFACRKKLKDWKKKIENCVRIWYFEIKRTPERERWRYN